MNLFKPSPSINYNFIVSIYGAFSLLGGLLYSLERYAFTQYKESASEDSGNANLNVDVDGEKSMMEELAESTEGLYLIFIPFVPCLLWSIVVRKEYCRLQAESSLKKKEE